MRIAIIPARAGSKRLPGKNIKCLAGKPLIAWTIEAAINCKLFDDVIVSTDSEAIAEIAIEYGATVPGLRPITLSCDNSSTNDVISYVVESYEESKGKSVNTITLLQPTSPLRNENHIIEAHKLMLKFNVSAVVSVCLVEFPIEFCNKLDRNNKLKGFMKEEDIKRSQDFDDYYRINGAIYMFQRRYVGRLLELYKFDGIATIMDSGSSIDIDTVDDFEYAEFKLNKRLA